MSGFTIGALVIIAIIGLLLGLFIGMYNRLVQLRNRFQNAFSQIDVQLKRRYDLIPNLVEVAKKYMQHERETLEAVIKARNQASAAVSRASSEPGSGQAMQGLLAAEATLASSLGRFFALAESYPDLKANQTMAQLSEELTSTENKVSFARQAFNDEVMLYNTAREQFPSAIIAEMFAFGPARLFEIADEAERQPQKVSF
jgi:LemA protein